MEPLVIFEAARSFAVPEVPVATEGAAVGIHAVRTGQERRGSIRIGPFAFTAFSPSVPL